MGAFVLLNQRIAMRDLTIGMTVQGSEGGTSVVLGKAERHVVDGTVVFICATEHGALIQQHNAIMEVSIHGPASS